VPYVEGPAKTVLLAQLAAGDPSPHVRCQAIRGLACLALAARDPASLVPWLARPDLPVVLESCRALVWIALSGCPVPPGAIDTALANVQGHAARAIVLRCLGATAAAAGEPPPACLLEALADPEVQVQLGALRGLELLGSQVPVPALEPLCSHPDPRVRAGAAAVVFLAGDPDRISILCDLLAKANVEEADLLAGLDAMLLLGLSLPIAADDRDWFVALHGRMAGASPTAEVPSHARVQLPSRSVWSQPAAAARRTATVRVLRPGGSAPVTRPRPVTSGERGPLRDRSRLILPVTAAAALVGLLVVAPRAPAPVAVPAASAFGGHTWGHLRAWAITGSCTRWGPGVPRVALRCGDPVMVGDSVSTDAAARLALRDRAGNSMALEQGGVLHLLAATVEAGAGKGQHVRYTVDVPSGDFRLDARGEPETELRVGSSTLLMRHGALSSRLGGRGRRLEALVGSAKVRRANQVVTALAQGESIMLPGSE
jgi:hypothetical protein